MQKVENQGSVRVDLLGGTLDIHPMNLVIPHCTTLNVATSLRAKVVIQRSENDGIVFHSLDYDKTYYFQIGDFSKESFDLKEFKEMGLLASLLHHINRGSEELRGLHFEISSGAPAGSGLGGSSAMGVTFYKALSDFFSLSYSRDKILKEVMDIEAMVLNCGPTGYQDYYPALYGGVLALNAKAGSIEVQQLFSEELKSALEEYVTLVFSGKSRFSAINNWEVYKSFFDREEKVVRGLEKIATLSTKAVRSIIDRDYRKLLDLIIQEGLVRKTLFSNIETAEMSELLNELQQIDDRCGIKVCGAGGGGCFLIIHPEVPKSDVEKIVTEHEMKVLDFYIEEPL